MSHKHLLLEQVLTYLDGVDPSRLKWERIPDIDYPKISIDQYTTTLEKYTLVLARFPSGFFAPFYVSWFHVLKVVDTKPRPEVYLTEKGYNPELKRLFSRIHERYQEHRACENRRRVQTLVRTVLRHD